MNGKTVLITGGTGSFGKKFTQHLLKKYKKIKKLIVYSRDELKQSEMAMTLSDKKYKCLRYFLGDVRDITRLSRAMKNVDVVIHAAALKQVPMAEYNPIEFIKTNVMGAQNIIESALDNKVKRVIALSTDKAAAPINLYGATKLCSEKLFISANNISGNKNIKFSVVRYGNVFGSRGSVYPVFKKFKDSNYFPITDLKMTRFNMSLKESVDFVTWSLVNSIGGEIFVPKLPSYNIVDLAKAVDNSKKNKIIGIRPGEKIHEVLISDSELHCTYDCGKYFAIYNNPPLKISKKIRKKRLKKVKLNSYSSGNNLKFLNKSQLKKIIKDFEK